MNFEAIMKTGFNLFSRMIHWKKISKITPNLFVGDITLQDFGGEELDLDHIFDVRNVFNEEFNPIWPNAYEFAKEIAELIRQGKKVALHCYGGIDRSPFIASLVLHILLNRPLDETYEAVLKQRPQAFRHYEWERSYYEWRQRVRRK